jgi:hypothetical protein
MVKKEEVVVVEEEDCCTDIAKIVRRRKRRGKGELPKNWSTNSYIPSTSTYLCPLF